MSDKKHGNMLIDLFNELIEKPKKRAPESALFRVKPLRAVAF